MREAKAGGTRQALLKTRNVNRFLIIKKQTRFQQDPFVLLHVFVGLSQCGVGLRRALEKRGAQLMIKLVFIN